MYQITEQEIPQEIIDTLIPQNIKLREKLIRKANEQYQYNIDCYNKVNSGDYSTIQTALEYHLFNFC